MSKLEKDCLAFVVGDVIPQNKWLIVRVVESATGIHEYNGLTYEPSSVESWVVEAQGSGLFMERLNGQLHGPYRSRLYAAGNLQRIDNPGDESFVTEARKSLSAPLERAKPAEVEA